MAAADRYERLVELQVTLFDTNSLYCEQKFEVFGEERITYRDSRRFTPELKLTYEKLCKEVEELLDYVINNFAGGSKYHFYFHGLGRALNTLSVDVLKSISDIEIVHEILKVLLHREKVDVAQTVFEPFFNWLNSGTGNNPFSLPFRKVSR